MSGVFKITEPRDSKLIEKITKMHWKYLLVVWSLVVGVVINWEDGRQAIDDVNDTVVVT